MIKIKTNIKFARERSGKQQKECASAIGVTLRAWQGYEQGIREPKYEILCKIAELFNVTTDYLLGRPEAEPPKDPVNEFVDRTNMPSKEKAALAKWLSLDSQKRQAVLDVMTEIVREYEAAEEENKRASFILIRRHVNKASAGTGYDLDNEDNWTNIKVMDCPEARKADFAIEVDGDSMNPNYNDGDTVYIVVDPNVPIGKVGLFRMGERGFIKRCGEGRLISDNPEYDDIYPQENEDIECIGRVIGTAELPE